MRFLNTSSLFLFTACLAQVLAHGGDNGNGNTVSGTDNGNDNGRQAQASASTRPDDNGDRTQGGRDRDSDDGNRSGDNRNRNGDDGTGNAAGTHRHHQTGDNGDTTQGDRNSNRGDGTRDSNGENGSRNRGDGQRDQIDSNFNGTASGRQGQLSISTVTITTQIAVAGPTVTPLTVMTVTITESCVAGSPGPSDSRINSDANAVATSVIAAPIPALAGSSASSEVSTARKFITPAAEIQPGLTSLPVAVASALGADPNVVAPSAPPAPPGPGNNATVSPGNFANSAAPSASVFTGVTFTTSGDVVPGRSSIAVASQIPANAR